ncbi:TetR/AcrR family transcriptional regulator, partial [Streptomyces sp. NPDC127079]|uniref:TetR/AcrR family transcriptional regulator n=1 Tax=Streptomyces sp. NPDC127079 TaxID=3347132 RepID=UPI0036696818
PRAGPARRHRRGAPPTDAALTRPPRGATPAHGSDVSLEDVARRAGVGIGTLYRNFPTRRDLFESVYADEVNALCQAAVELGGQEPWQALTSWLDRFTGYMVTKRAVREALNDESEIFSACRDSMFAAGGPLLERAQKAGVVRTDMEIGDLLRMVSGITATAFEDEAQRDRVMGIALDGVRTVR